MMVIRVSDSLKYNVDRLQKGVEVSKNIPKIVITVGHDEES